MIRLKSGARAADAVAALHNASQEANNLLTAGYSFRDLSSKYLEWSVNQERLLGNAYASAQVATLIQTRRHWAILGMPPESYGPALGGLVSLELQDRIARFDHEATLLSEVDAQWNVRWQESAFPESLHAVVPDTNVFMRHATTLAEQDWSAIIGRRPLESIGLATLAVVIDELDSLKLASGEMRNVGGKTYSRRSLAQRALNQINASFAEDNSSVTLRESSLVPGRGPISAIQQILVLDDLEHVRLPTADAEILDQALAIQPFARSVTVVSYDSNLIFMARQLGLGAYRFTSPTDD